MGVIHTIKAVLPAMLKRNAGTIMVTGSIGACMGALTHCNVHPSVDVDQISSSNV